MVEIEVNFRDPKSIERSCREGWGGAEEFGAWMTGPVSRLILPSPPRTDYDFEFRAVIGPRIHNSILERQRMHILVNGYSIFNESMTELGRLHCVVPASVIALYPYIEIIFDHPDATSSSSMEMGNDVRPLAASIWNLTLFSPSLLPPLMPEIFTQSIFQTRPIGNLANRMIQYMVALAVQEQAPGCSLMGAKLPEWGIISRPDDGAWADLALVDEQFIDIANIASILNTRTLYKITHRGYGQRLENFLSHEYYEKIFVNKELDISGFDARYIVINIRSGDIVNGSVPIYVLLPLNFYRDLIKETGLIPVFIGQLEKNVYTDALREMFPEAIYYDSQGPMRDFEWIRKSKNIVISVSTFSWLAAWLSNADQIFMPINGLFNPLQVPSVDLVPIKDSRYRFYLFPINTASPDFHSAHKVIDGQWQEISADELATVLSSTIPDDNAVSFSVMPNPSKNDGFLGNVIRMFEDNMPIIAEAEISASRGYVIDVLQHLRKLPLVDYADLIWSLPRSDFPALSAILPKMASEEVQLGWNGKSGTDLRNHTVDFCRILSSRFQQITGRSIDHARIMDFGCGWGRMMRMLYWYTDPQNCCGVDAMPLSIHRCKEEKVLGRLVNSEYVANDIDVGDRRYDLIFAFSVFIHTPMHVAQVALQTLHRKLKRNGVLAITIRPIEYWAQSGSEEHAQAHQSSGFSFKSLGVVGSDGKDIYGETSMTIEWIIKNFPDWEVEVIDRGLDPMQLIVFLTPR